MAFAEYADYDGLGLAELVKKGEVTPLELADAAIERAERHNGTLNAIVYEAYDEAREAAKGKLPDGPFKGVPFLIKEPFRGGRRGRRFPSIEGADGPVRRSAHQEAAASNA